MQIVSAAASEKKMFFRMLTTLRILMISMIRLLMILPIRNSGETAMM